MENKFPAPANEVQQLYSQISHIVESRSGVEPQRLVRDWNTQLFKDMRSEAEVLMLMHGQSVSDRYLYGFCSALASLRAENGGILPSLTDGQYEMDKELQDSHMAAEDEAAVTYFEKLETTFIEKFPLTATLVGELGRDLKWRLNASTEDINEGFVPGWRRAVRTAMPLFIE